MTPQQQAPDIARQTRDVFGPGVRLLHDGERGRSCYDLATDSEQAYQAKLGVLQADLRARQWR